MTHSCRKTHGINKRTLRSTISESSRLATAPRVKPARGPGLAERIPPKVLRKFQPQKEPQKVAKRKEEEKVHPRLQTLVTS